MFAPIEVGIFLEAFAPLFPAVFWKFVNHVAVGIEDVGSFAKKNVENLAHMKVTLAAISGRDNFSLAFEIHTGQSEIVGSIVRDFAALSEILIDEFAAAN